MTPNDVAVVVGFVMFIAVVVIIWFIGGDNGR